MNVNNCCTHIMAKSCRYFRKNPRDPLQSRRCITFAIPSPHCTWRRMFPVKIEHGIHKYLAAIICSCCTSTRMTARLSDKRRRGLLTLGWFYSRWHALSRTASASSSSSSLRHLRMRVCKWLGRSEKKKKRAPRLSADERTILRRNVRISFQTSTITNPLF